MVTGEITCDFSVFLLLFQDKCNDNSVGMCHIGTNPDFYYRSKLQLIPPPPVYRSLKSI